MSTGSGMGLNGDRIRRGRVTGREGASLRELSSIRVVHFHLIVRSAWHGIRRRCAHVRSVWVIIAHGPIINRCADGRRYVFRTSTPFPVLRTAVIRGCVSHMRWVSLLGMEWNSAEFIAEYWKGMDRWWRWRGKELGVLRSLRVRQWLDRLYMLFPSRNDTFLWCAL